MITNENLREPQKDGGAERRPDRYFHARQALNLLFMAGALAGVAVYFLASHDTGVIVMLAACALKFAECALRLIR